MLIIFSLFSSPLVSFIDPLTALLLQHPASAWFYSCSPRHLGPDTCTRRGHNQPQTE